MSKNITEKQKAILDYIIKVKSNKGNMPTLAEIALEFGYKNRSTVQQQLEALENKGFIKRNKKLSRGIELTVEDKLFISRPILGEVAAGNPLTIYPDSIDTIELPTIVNLPGDSFLLKVKGDSLKDAYIFDNDIVIVNPNLIPINGQIVVAVLEDSAVIKRYFKFENRIELHSENIEYQPIIIERDRTKFTIVGVVIGIYRSMEKRAV
ncbi:MAG TPA: transcriptional repressor LexA [Melioribacteraceae bacterium]|nr:transcriptional repressor LexA [Melioribacteraceae bacterium]